MISHSRSSIWIKEKWITLSLAISHGNDQMKCLFDVNCYILRQNNAITQFQVLIVWRMLQECHTGVTTISQRAAMHASPGGRFYLYPGNLLMQRLFTLRISVEMLRFGKHHLTWHRCLPVLLVRNRTTMNIVISHNVLIPWQPRCHLQL